MAKPDTYAGIDKDIQGGMTNIGKIIRDAWVFGLIEETETCEGWNSGRIDILVQQVGDEWDKYDCLVSHLPEDLRERHQRIHSAGIETAKKAGWSGEVETDNEL